MEQLNNNTMKRILLISLILLIPLIHGCLPPIMYDDNGCYGGGDASARVSVNGISMYGWETDGYSVTYGTKDNLINIYMMGAWDTSFDVYVGDVVYLEVMAGATAVDIAIDIYQNYTRIYTNHLYVVSYDTGILSVEISDH